MDEIVAVAADDDLCALIPHSKINGVITAVARVIDKGNTVKFFGPGPGFHNLSNRRHIPLDITVVAEKDFIVAIFAGVSHIAVNNITVGRHAAIPGKIAIGICCHRTGRRIGSRLVDAT